MPKNSIVVAVIHQFDYLFNRREIHAKKSLKNPEKIPKKSAF